MERVEINIDNRTWRAWESVELEWSMDSYSTVKFTAPFEPERLEFRETFRPFTFKRVEVTIEGEQIFVGWMVDINPSITPDRKEVEVTAYALPAVFANCTMPVASLPLEFTNMKLLAIASQLGLPFGVRVHYLQDERGHDGAPFPKVAIDPAQKVQDFLVELAKHRNLVLTNTPNGELVFWRSTLAGAPIARLKDNEQPVVSVEGSFSPQDYYSEITGFAKNTKRKQGGKATAKNPFLTDVLRPLTFKLDDLERGEAPETAMSQLGRMFANMCSFNVELATWRDPNDLLWQPNLTVTLEAPNSMIYSETELLIRSVTFRQSKESESASLGLILPGSFAGELPERLPWTE